MLGHLAEIDGQVFGRRREHAHAVAHGRQRVVAHQVETSQRERGRRGFFDQQLRAGDGETSPALMMRAPPTVTPLMLTRLSGDGIEQPAPGHGAQRWPSGGLSGGGASIVVGAHGARCRIEHHARAVTRLVLRGAQHDRRVE